MRTAREIIHNTYAGQPELKLAESKSGACIGAWDVDQGRYVMVAGKALTGDWVTMPYELLLNGKPPVAAEDWIPVPNPANKEVA